MGSSTLELVRHPETAGSSVEAITVQVERSASGAIWLRYHADGVPDALALPNPADPVRSDGLWKTTCFELFVRVSRHADYVEYNFSPSGQWAAYRFDDYRVAMKDLHVNGPIEIGLDASETHFALEATVDPLPGWQSKALSLALSAVIEETAGTKSYWALRHPPGPPDFHHPDCFAITLEPPS